MGPINIISLKRLTEKCTSERQSQYLTYLGYYKYSFDQDKCKKPNSLVALNLASPRIGYESHGKSRINHLTFAEVIADVVEKAAKGGDDKDGR